ncbi:DUF2332 domain-containing protein [Microbacterium sediminis]|uniref:Uncharacterized protein n=1 Tax=Microbacterium sediminis TaxID=904291 RepID=A0A1B9NBF8_9MICO|nr:DUF2332 domain-containing protein [Microbacterium sediminis]OCG73951.1 hypothetical protein A7J15_07030 [Microbacterium sediminis]QBR74705.1 DUF2332 domain-containing protein [Microbacterium sediminis]
MEERAAQVRDRYARFARDEAPGRSALYAAWATGVAADEEVCRILARLDPPHRQPPLVFAVTRLLGSGEGSYREWARFVRAHADRVVAECAARSIQTNEPGRCAPLLYALQHIPGPIALLEVGASAGLCLYPDRYAYRFHGEDAIAELGRSAVVIDATLRGRTPAPRTLPEIVWRAGIDPQPRVAADAGDRDWITGLVWPGETGRAERIRAALDIAAADPPVLVAADASAPGVLADLASRAPAGATLVITTPGVLPHVPRAARERLIDAIRAIDARWITLDAPALHDAWTRRPDPEGWEGFALALDGEVIAAADPLGAWIAAV